MSESLFHTVPAARGFRHRFLYAERALCFAAAPTGSAELAARRRTAEQDMPRHPARNATAARRAAAPAAAGAIGAASAEGRGTVFRRPTKAGGSGDRTIPAGQR